MKYRVFIVEDDDVICSAIASHLETWGFETRIADDFETVLAQFAAFSPHLVLLDIGLPRFNGYYWCSEIRKVASTPIIFISSAADGMNIVTAMNMGGDDFVAKPFDLPVLTAKVQALLRRTYDYAPASTIIECCGVVLDTAAGRLDCPGGRVELTRNEHRIMQLLFERRGKIVSRDAMMVALWESDDFIDDNTLTVNMSRLRKKLEAVGQSRLILTRKGEGYMVGE